MRLEFDAKIIVDLVDQAKKKITAHDRVGLIIEIEKILNEKGIRDLVYYNYENISAQGRVGIRVHISD